MIKTFDEITDEDEDFELTDKVKSELNKRIKEIKRGKVCSTTEMIERIRRKK